MDVRQTVQANQVGGSGVGSAANELPQDQQMLDVTDLDTEEPQLETLRDNTRQKILKHIQELQRLARWQQLMQSYANELEEFLFRRYPNKMDYYNMSKGPIQPHVQSAMTELNRMWAFSTINGTTVPRLGITRGPLSSGAMDPLNAYMGTSLPEEAPGEHVNTELSLGVNRKRQRSAASNSNHLVANMVNTPGTNSIMPKPTLAPPAPVDEPKLSCPICHCELVNASSTLCGHIFCLECVKTAVKLQRKCPTCRTGLPMDGYHRIYLPD